MKIIVLLSSYNGEWYIREQIDSLLMQTVGGIEILVRDDGSTDSTTAILEEYSRKRQLTYYSGSNIGYAKSFWELICGSGSADYYALCDQDDVWDPDKLEIAVSYLEETDVDRPALYFSDVRVTGSDLSPVSGHMIRPMPVDYPHSLIRNVSPGCTYVFNRAAAEILRKYEASVLETDQHDWNIYRIVSCFGQVIFDPRSHMSYRQHGSNCIGVNPGPGRYFSKISSFFNGKMTGSRQHAAQRMLDVYGYVMSERNRKITELLSGYPRSFSSKVKLISCKALKFSGFDRLCMILLIIMGKF